MKSVIISAAWAVALGLSGCTSQSTPAPATTVTVSAAASAPQINAETFRELDRLNDKFVARVSAVPEIRAEMMDLRDMSPTDLAHLAHQTCIDLNKSDASSPEMAMVVAGTLVEFAAYIASEPMSEFAKRTFVQSAADTFCPDNAAGVR